MIGQELAGCTSVEKEDVLRVYDQYLKGKPAVVLSIVTKEQPENLPVPKFQDQFR